MLSYLIYTLGCKLNQLESEALTDAFVQAGFVLHKGDASVSPSVIIVNTCTVTSKADQKARRVIRKALRDYKDSCIVITGCYALLNKDELYKLESGSRQRLFVLNKEEILDLPDYLNLQSKQTGEDFHSDNCDIGIALKQLAAASEQNKAGGGQERQNSAFQFNPERFHGHTRGFLKIQDGCGKHCTYCRIRLARGQSISLDSGQVLPRLKILEKSHAEAVLTGVNICQYCDSSYHNLAELLEYLLTGTEKINLRLSSLAPDCIDEKLVKIFLDKRIRPHFHLSIQSGSEQILEKMGRSYTPQNIEQAISLLRGAKDTPFLACDIITGFPGETETEFIKTYELCKKNGFAWIHVFPYSKRPGTPAWSFKGTVQEKEVFKRVQMLTDLAWQGRREYAQSWLGRKVEVIVEAWGKEQETGSVGRRAEFCRGVSENYLKLLVKCNGREAPLPGTVLQCKLTELGNLKDYDAFAEILA